MSRTAYKIVCKILPIYVEGLVSASWNEILTHTHTHTYTYGGNLSF